MPKSWLEHSDPSNAPKDFDSQTAHAYHELWTRIANLSLKPGEVVSEKTLSTSLDIGRTPVREALRDLANEQLVVVLPQRGIIISEVESVKQLKLVEVRGELLKLSVSIISRRRKNIRESDLDQINEMILHLKSTFESNDREGLLRGRYAYATFLAEISRNEFIHIALQQYEGLYRRFFNAHFASVSELRELVALDVGLLESVAGNDHAAALEKANALKEADADLARAVLEAS